MTKDQESPGTDKASPSPAPDEGAEKIRALLFEILRLVYDHKVGFIENLGGGIWTWPDRAKRALEETEQ